MEMVKVGAKWESWGTRLRAHLKKKKSNLAKLAEKVERSEPTLRSWTNGTRQINLVDFFYICEAAEADPAIILFGTALLSQEQSKAIRDLASTLPSNQTQ